MCVVQDSIPSIRDRQTDTVVHIFQKTFPRYSYIRYGGASVNVTKVEDLLS